MNKLVGPKHTLDELQSATEAYVVHRTKIWRGACWYRPNSKLYLEWDDETLYQVAEVLCCTKEEAEGVLKLLKVSGTFFVFASKTQVLSVDDDEDEFDEEGWLIGSSKNPRQNPSFRHVVGRDRRYLGVLSWKGLRLQVQILMQDGMRRVFFPSHDDPILAEYALDMSLRYESKELKQMRYFLNLQVDYLVASCEAI